MDFPSSWKTQQIPFSCQTKWKDWLKHPICLRNNLQFLWKFTHKRKRRSSLVVREAYVTEEGWKIFSFSPNIVGFQRLCFVAVTRVSQCLPLHETSCSSCSKEVSLLERRKTLFTFSLLFLIVSGLVICVEFIFSVWIAAAYKDHSLHLLVPSTDEKSVRIRVGSFLCWALPTSGNTQCGVFLSHWLPLEHNTSQLSLALFKFMQSPFEIICTLGFHNIFTWRLLQ